MKKHKKPRHPRVRTCRTCKVTFIVADAKVRQSKCHPDCTVPIDWDALTAKIKAVGFRKKQ